jgi:hypothetical protein
MNLAPYNGLVDNGAAAKDHFHNNQPETIMWEFESIMVILLTKGRLTKALNLFVAEGSLTEEKAAQVKCLQYYRKDPKLAKWKELYGDNAIFYHLVNFALNLTQNSHLSFVKNALRKIAGI